MNSLEGGGEPEGWRKDREESCYVLGGVEQVEEGRGNTRETQETQS